MLNTGNRLRAYRRLDFRKRACNFVSGLRREAELSRDLGQREDSSNEQSGRRRTSGRGLDYERVLALRVMLEHARKEHLEAVLAAWPTPRMEVQS